MQGGKYEEDCMACRKINCRKNKVQFSIDNCRVVHLGKNNPIFTSWIISELTQRSSGARPLHYNRQFHENIT